MAKWKIQPKSRRFDGPAPGGADVTHGENVYLKSLSGTETKIAVWFASGYAGDLSAKTAVREWLDEAAPPAHLLVTDGGVSALSLE